MLCMSAGVISRNCINSLEISRRAQRVPKRRERRENNRGEMLAAREKASGWCNQA